MAVNVLIEPNNQSSDAIWIQWHKDLKSVLGKKMANSIWILYWEKRGSDDANTNALRTYASSQGFSISGGALGSVIDTFYNIGDKIGDIFKVGEYATIAIVVILLGSIGLLLFNIAKAPVESIKAAGEAARSTPAA